MIYSSHFSIAKTVTHLCKQEIPIFEDAPSRELIKALAHYTQNRCSSENCLIFAVVKKVVVCIEENCMFCNFVCSVQGPLNSKNG